MIHVGSLCLLVGAHMLAGRCCTVTSGLEWGIVQHPDGRHVTVQCYTIEVPGCRAADGYELGATPRHLVPLGAPSMVDIEGDRIEYLRETLVEMGARLRRMRAAHQRARADPQ